MVSKITRRTPPNVTTKTKPKPKLTPRRRRHHHSPLKSLAAAAPAAVVSSLRSCRRRLIKLFSRIAVLASPSSSSKPHRHLPRSRYRRLSPSPFDDHPSSTPLLPPPSSPRKKTIFLDLDETLVHSNTDPPPDRYDFAVRPKIDGKIMTFYVLKRPGADEFLRGVSASFEVVAFTAGLREYASLVLDQLDPAGDLISHRLYRDSCKEMEGKFVKDLSELGRSLDGAVIVDDNPNAYVLQPENAVPVSPFVDDLGDVELPRLLKFFEVAVHFDDLRDAVAYYLAGDGGRTEEKVA